MSNELQAMIEKMSAREDAIADLVELADSKPNLRLAVVNMETSKPPTLTLTGIYGSADKQAKHMFDSAASFCWSMLRHDGYHEVVKLEDK